MTFSADLLHAHLATFDAKLDGITRLLTERLEHLEGAVTHHRGNADMKFDGVDARVSDPEDRVAALEMTKVKVVAWAVGLGVVAAALWKVAELVVPLIAG